MLSWSSRRKLLYGGSLSIVALALALFLGIAVFSKPPTCFDNAQNGGETGVDCGGPCARICADVAHAPVVVWSRALPSGDGSYTAAADIENPNAGLGAGAYGVHYAFRLFDSDNLLVMERDGVVDIPPQQRIVLVEPGLQTGDRKVAHAFLEFGESIPWTKIPKDELPAIRIEQQTLAQDGSSLSAQVVNEGGSDVRNLTVAAVLFDADGVAQAASKSTFSRLAQNASEPLIFTWPSGVAGIVRAELTPIVPLPPQPSQP